MTRLSWKEALLPLASGVLTALAMPGFGVFPLVFVSLIPLFWVLARRGGFLPGFLFGFAFFAIDLRWLVTLSRFHPLVIAGYALLATYFGAGCGVLGLLITWRRRHEARTWLILAPALLAFAEYLRTFGPLGMGFSSLYQALYRIPWLIQSASILGPWFISSALVAINGALFLAIRRRKAVWGLVAGGLVLTLLAFTLQHHPPASDTLQVAVISSKVQQEVKLDAHNLDELTNRYLDLGEQAAATDPDLIVFPESILPTYILRNDSAKSALSELAQRTNAQVLVGTGILRDRKIYNAVALFDPGGMVSGTYEMVCPVPFGEYIPGRGILDWLGLGDWADSFLPIDLSRGSGFTPLSLYGTPICFESTFPAPSRHVTRHGAQLLVTVTNDAWFNESSELAAHFSTAVFRAIENRRWVIQSANGGISGIISPRGRIVASLNAEGVIDGEVDLVSGLSPYTRLGDWWCWLLATAIVAVLLNRLIHRRMNGGARS